MVKVKYRIETYGYDGDLINKRTYDDEEGCREFLKIARLQKGFAGYKIFRDETKLVDEHWLQED